MEELQPITVLVIDGTERRNGSGSRFLVRVNEKELYIDRTSFRLLVLLATADCRLHDELALGFANATKYVWRLKNLIFAKEHGFSLPIRREIGAYALDIERGRIQVNVDALRRFPDADIRALVN